MSRIVDRDNRWPEARSMSKMSKKASRFAPDLPASLAAEQRGNIAIVTLKRPHKRNALDDTTVQGLQSLFAALPNDIKAVVLNGAGEHFSAGLDLTEITERSTAEGVEHSASWHRAFQHIEFGKAPVVAVLHGAVVGGGLELAAAAHVRIAERSAYYALPEGSRGIYVGGGASVRLPRLIGVSRMQEMMLTGRVYNAEEGHGIGLSHYLVEDGEGLAKGIALAKRIAENAPLTNFAITQVLPRIAESDPTSGYLAESLMAAIAQGSDEAKTRLKDFLEKRGKKVLRG
jgi:enoyl-CoA hydratase/carnithine racemase